jgi:hypothetical protein
VEKITRQILLQTTKSGTTDNISVTGYLTGTTESDFNVILNLQQKHQNFGYYQSVPIHSEIDGLETTIPINEGPNMIPYIIDRFVITKYTVTGETESKLDLVKSVDPLIPYKVGLNGVTQVNTDTIVYTIDLINYITYLSDGKTYYFFGGHGISPKDFNNNPVIFDEVNHGFLEKFKTKSDININRGNISAFDSHIRLSNIKNIADLITYGGNYFNIIKNN